MWAACWFRSAGRPRQADSCIRNAWAMLQGRGEEPGCIDDRGRCHGGNDVGPGKLAELRPGRGEYHSVRFRGRQGGRGGEREAPAQLRRQFADRRIKGRGGCSTGLQGKRELDRARAPQGVRTRLVGQAQDGDAPTLERSEPLLKLTQGPAAVTVVALAYRVYQCGRRREVAAECCQRGNVAREGSASERAAGRQVGAL